MTIYKPFLVKIISISQNVNAVVTTDINHSFVIGNTVKFLIPATFGMKELDGKIANILDVTDNTFTIDINTFYFSPFSVPASYYTPAQALPCGDTNFSDRTNGIVEVPPTISGSFRVTN